MQTNNQASALAIVPPQHMPMAVESASTFAAATAKATVEARYLIAMRKPRSWDQVRVDMLKECSRPSFAHNKSALYRKPIGQGVEGLGIRFAEMGLRCMTNVLIESALVFEDDGKEIHRVTLTDLESNVTYPQDFKVTKTVERSKPEDDGTYFSVRVNSGGKATYTVRGTDDDILNKRGALLSKAIRTIALRIIPGDILDECEAKIRAIRKDRAASDPDGERRSIVDDFASINVTPTMLAEYLGHDISQCAPAQMVELRGLFGAIHDGEASWAQAMEAKADGKAPPIKPPAPPAPPTEWPDDAFRAQLRRWAKAVEMGIKTTDEIMAMARSRGALSADQETAIRALRKAPPPAAAPAPATDPATDPNADFLADMEAAEGGAQ